MARSIPSSLRFGAVGVGGSDIAPMSEMNTTPLIDVMLVLLIMFIITVPTQTHEVELALGGKPPPVELPIRLKNELMMDRSGALAWNGRSISDGQLVALLGEVGSRKEQPEVHFRPDQAARYARVDAVLAIAARSGATSFGFAGNEQYSKVF